MSFYLPLTVVRSSADLAPQAANGGRRHPSLYISWSQTVGGGPAAGGAWPLPAGGARQAGGGGNSEANGGQVHAYHIGKFLHFLWAPLSALLAFRASPMLVYRGGLWEGPDMCLFTSH